MLMRSGAMRLGLPSLLHTAVRAAVFAGTSTAVATRMRAAQQAAAVPPPAGAAPSDPVPGGPVPGGHGADAPPSPPVRPTPRGGLPVPSVAPVSHLAPPPPPASPGSVAPPASPPPPGSLAPPASPGSVAPPASPVPPEPPVPPELTDEVVAQLRRLGELRDADLVTDAEFTAKKHQLLGL